MCVLFYVVFFKHKSVVNRQKGKCYFYIITKIASLLVNNLWYLHNFKILKLNNGTIMDFKNVIH